MNMTDQAITRYISELDGIYRSGKGTEHSYRPALKILLERLTTGLDITNEPKRIACGAPDYIVTRNALPVGYIEAKDISLGIHDKAHKEQFDRYKQSLNNLIITDYLNFELFVEGELAAAVSIASERKGGIIADPAQFAAFSAVLEQFTGYSGKTIYLSDELARVMADKAKLLAEVIKAALADKNAEDDALAMQLEAFRKVLIHDLNIPDFADMYAQTLAYGLFAARLNAPISAPFTRKTAADLIPQSNPFLRKFFQYIAGFDLDSRIAWMVDALAEVFNGAAVADILQEFENANQDPYIHFYETFLAQYDPVLRESRGVYYTPLPVVTFIVQAVDDILQKDLGLSQGLADSTKVKGAVKQKDGSSKAVELHKVHILEPATGTGTFLAEVIEKIYSRFANQKGMWQSYCTDHLIPRLNGFEILMAPYAMAHFKLDMKLKETGYKNAGRRLRVYLTNSLEEPEDSSPVLLMEKWLADEAKEAGSIKKDTPVMVVLGNPPYSVTSANKSPWMDGLLKEYKLEPNDGKLREKNPKMINDDYVKFIRYGQYFMEKNGSGILAYINNHSFLDNLTFRGMRWSLLQTFDKIYILDLHGNVRKHETSPDGGKDENVFNIQQGVSINIFVKTGKKKTGALATVYHYERYGRREKKYRFLLEHTITSISWKKLNPQSKYYFFVPKNFGNRAEYEAGFSIQALFPVYSSGIKTHDDAHLVGFSMFSENNQPYMYRPFDVRYINYDLKKVKRHRYEVMKHFLQCENTGLIAPRQAITGKYGIFISNTINDINYTGTAGQYGAGLTFPLYLYPDKDGIDKAEKRRPNLNVELVIEIAEKLGLRFTEEKEDNPETFAPIDILDYIYAVLHSPKYRKTYQELLKIDFPRVPYPADAARFRILATFGEALRKTHLLEGVEASPNLALYPAEGDNTLDKPEYKDEKVWINKTQYFEQVPPAVWEFYIGSYQPAQKWLKDRKGRTLSFDDIRHYQKIVKALYLTGTIQEQIDEVLYEE